VHLDVARSAAAQNPTVKITRAFARPDLFKVREFADDVRDGKFVLPIGRPMLLSDAAEAHVLRRKAELGRSPLARIYKPDCCTPPVRMLDPAMLREPSGAGRWQLPTTVIGLLVHIAEDTERTSDRP
jgi:hypothetical protein